MTNPVVENAPAANAAVEGENGLVADEDCSKHYEPVVKLEKVETKTGEEDEEVLFKMRSKLFRFSKELKEWKERGTGDVRILEHKESKKVRLLMRREKTLKICMNQYVNPETELRENVGSDRSWVWHAVDYADEERDEALLAIRFRDSKDANEFKDAYDKARERMSGLRTQLEGGEQKAEPDAEAAVTEKKEAEAEAKKEPEQQKSTEKSSS
ncbi:Ran-specific GTPase-activating protein [Gracilariopsis chorda]|uniref:Ran-specific GTPase-activating protein n=1 Tax=Gracilariopsis chorda TaxID=448386 RepID=A0A2V3IX40_9FLOR|nr:Ran-specific GTPase-activating protein [Gracilariopsis chorda]|eukprot:PXF46635.1 Ran-specific GTPase-activating protein [Gracilariopsis chorda]